ncbi:MAG: hypothetical protein M1821_004739 [Bathelium mastoideum]|nr:MAG: hypothetical protein M1821_004739 [Bathelium mastoideum]KAI9692149.1 MAG: hypothetical protein M1822_006379 [Bathelium mastoideum]
MAGDVASRIYYLDRAERFEREKPFNWSTELAALPNLPESNHVVSPQSVIVHDIRERSPASLDVEGFAFVKSPTSLKPDDFDDEATIETRYYSEIEELLWKEYPQFTGMAFLGYQVRKRSSKFPHEEGALVTSAQPQTLAHADLTVDGARYRLKNHFKDEPTSETRPWEMLKYKISPLAVLAKDGINS